MKRIVQDRFGWPIEESQLQEAKPKRMTMKQKALDHAEREWINGETKEESEQGKKAYDLIQKNHRATIREYAGLYDQWVSMLPDEE